MGQIYFTNDELAELKSNCDATINLGSMWYTEKELILASSISLKVEQEIQTRNAKKSLNLYRKPTTRHVTEDSK